MEKPKPHQLSLEFYPLKVPNSTYFGPWYSKNLFNSSKNCEILLDRNCPAMPPYMWWLGSFDTNNFVTLTELSWSVSPTPNMLILKGEILLSFINFEIVLQLYGNLLQNSHIKPLDIFEICPDLSSGDTRVPPGRASKVL